MIRFPFAFLFAAWADPALILLDVNFSPPFFLPGNHLVGFHPASFRARDVIHLSDRHFFAFAFSFRRFG